MQEAYAGKDTLLLDPVVAPRIAAARLALGLLQGCVLYVLYSALQDKTWLAGAPYLFGPLLLCALLLPILLISSLGHMPARRIAGWIIAAAAIMVLLSVHDIWRHVGELRTALQKESRSQPLSSLLLVFCGAGFFIAHTLVLAAGTERRRIAAYATYFETAWKLGIQLLFSLLFVGVLWAVLWMGAALFMLLKLDFLEHLLGHAWFVIPVLCFAFSCAIHITDVRPAIVRGIRTLLLVLLSWLLPITALMVAGFLLTLPFTGLERLWATRHATGVLLGVAAALVILINAAFQNGEVGHGVARLVRLSARLAALLLLPLVGIGVYALGLRVIAYGWTSDRIIAAACVLVAACYAFGYAWAGRQRGNWLAQIASVNIATSFVILGALLALFSPLADPARLSVASQMARFEAGKIAADKFDVVYLRFEGARYGQAALERLKTWNAGIDAAVVRARAVAAIQRASRWDESPRADKAINLTVHPDGVRLPASFLAQQWEKNGAPSMDFPTCLTDGGVRCDAHVLDFDGDGKLEVLLVSNGVADDIVLLAQNSEGAWRVRGKLNATPLRCKGLLEKLKAGQFRLATPKLQDVEIDGQRVRIGSIDEQEYRCSMAKPVP